MPNSILKPRDLTDCTRWFWGALLIVSLWRIFAAIRLDLCLDEGYYHYWSLFPQLSYFDHPPFTAWSMSLLGLCFGDSIWTVRFWPVVTAAGFALTGRALAARMFGSASAGNRAGLLLTLTPVFIGNGLLMTPDTFMALFWALALYFTWRALEPGGSFGWWIATGACVGLGLLSKYNMVLFFLGLGLLWVITPGRRLAIFSGAWITGVLALLIFSPVLFWNWQQDWVSFRFQLSHGFSSHTQSVASNLAFYLIGLMLLATPLLSGLCFWSCGKGIRSPHLQERFLSVFFWVVILFFGYSSLNTHGKMNWAMLAFFSGVLLVAGNWPDAAKAWRSAALGLLIACDLLGMAYLLLPPQLQWLPWDHRRIREFFNAESTAQVIASKFRASGADFLCVTSHQMFGRLSFYTPQLRATLWEPEDGRRRYPWINDRQWAGKTALWVSEEEQKKTSQKYFQQVTDLGTIPLPPNGASESKLYLYQGRGYLPEAVKENPAP